MPYVDRCTTPQQRGGCFSLCLGRRVLGCGMWGEHLARTASLTKLRFSPCTTSHTPRTPCATTPSYTTGYSPFSSCCVTPWFIHPRIHARTHALADEVCMACR
jgi:hypothetical protein